MSEPSSGLGCATCRHSYAIKDHLLGCKQPDVVAKFSKRFAKVPILMARGYNSPCDYSAKLHSDKKG